MTISKLAMFIWSRNFHYIIICKSAAHAAYSQINIPWKFSINKLRSHPCPFGISLQTNLFQTSLNAPVCECQVKHFIENIIIIIIIILFIFIAKYPKCHSHSMTSSITHKVKWTVASFDLQSDDRFAENKGYFTPITNIRDK